MNFDACLPRPATPHFGASAPAAAAPVTAADITMVICIRLHDGNPWVLDRLPLIAAHYDPAPKVVIVDFGSGAVPAGQIERICEACGYDYLHIPDYDTFSLSAARNRGFEATSTPFVYFCDIDMFGYPDLFAQLAREATELRMREVVDIVLNPPIHHLGEEVSSAFFAAPDAAARGGVLKRAAFGANFEAYDAEGNHFTAPYSNVFLIHRDMYSMVGGYDERFRGHGSEDFELLVRLAVHSGHLPRPEELRRDLYGPMKDGYFDHKDYRGFRRLLELASRPAADLGQKTFHLWHPRQRAQEWYSANDWKRNKLNEAFDTWLDHSEKLLGIDFLARDKGTLAALCGQPDQWGYFQPLRAAGWRIDPVLSDAPDEIGRLVEGLKSGRYDAIAIFNPYMKSNARFYDAILLARELGVKTIVIERGALPGSIYYADDVSYASDAYAEPAFLAESFSDAELDAAGAYVARLREGAQTLESMDDYAATKAARIALTELDRKIVFVPLQLSDDMAVTMFVKGETRYAQFVESLPQLFADNPDILFVVKQHPLSMDDGIGPQPNVILADRRDNVHFLLDLADLTLCYNSGVGLLSILHGTPTATLGNAFYDLDGAGYHAADAADAIAAFREGRAPTPQDGLIRRLAAWFTLRKYSSFVAVDSIREFKERKAHGYRDILVTCLRLDGEVLELDRLRRVSPFHWKSHGAVSAGVVEPSARPAADPSRAPEPWRLANWGHGRWHKGEFAEALELYDRALAAKPDDSNLLRYKAETLIRLGRRREAIAAQAAAVRLLPVNKNVRRRLATLTFPPLKLLWGARAMTPPKP